MHTFDKMLTCTGVVTFRSQFASIDVVNTIQVTEKKLAYLIICQGASDERSDDLFFVALIILQLLTDFFLTAYLFSVYYC